MCGFIKFVVTHTMSIIERYWHKSTLSVITLYFILILVIKKSIHCQIPVRFYNIYQNTFRFFRYHSKCDRWINFYTKIDCYNGIQRKCVQVLVRRRMSVKTLSYCLVYTRHRVWHPGLNCFRPLVTYRIPRRSLYPPFNSENTKRCERSTSDVFCRHYVHEDLLLLYFTVTFSLFMWIGNLLSNILNIQYNNK